MTRLVGLLLRDVVLSRDEVDGLMAGLLTSDSPPTGTIRLGDWLKHNGELLENRAEKPWLGREISAVKPRRTESGTIAVRAGPRRKWP